MQRFPKSLGVRKESLSMPPIIRIGKYQILQMFYPTAIYLTQGEKILESTEIRFLLLGKAL